MDAGTLLSGLYPVIATLFLWATEKWLLASPGGLPMWLGLGDAKGPFPRIAAGLRDWRRGAAGVMAGYSKFGIKGQFFTVSDPPFRTEVMVPRKHLRWVFEQPENVVSAHDARFDKFGLDFILREHDNDADRAVERVFLDTVHSKLTRSLTKLQPAVAGEVSRNMDAMLGTDTERWTEVNVCHMVEKTVLSAILHVLVGQPLCRDDKFHQEINGHSTAIGYNFIVVGHLLPSWLRPTLGWIFSRYTWATHRRLIKKWFVPMVTERFENLSRKHHDASFDYTPPQDLVTWASDALLVSGKVERCSPYDLACRLAFMMPGAIPSVKSTTTSAIYDIISSPPDMLVREHLHDEIAAALDASSYADGNPWADPGLLPRLVLLNSAIRESMRLSPPGTVISDRKIISDTGLTLPSGEHLARGTYFAVPVAGFHADETIYSDAAAYRPFRFCSRQPGEQPTAPEETTRQVTSTAVVNINDSFLSFGFGKTACPGRWLAAHIMKITIAYLLYHYEIKPLAQRPPNQVMFGVIIPDQKQTMMVRRRKH